MLLYGGRDGLCLRELDWASLRAQLSLGWGVWKQLGSKAHDYNLSFATGSAQALQAALGPKEAADIKCVFRADLGDDWPRYLKTYGAGAPSPHPPTPAPHLPPTCCGPRTCVFQTLVPVTPVSGDLRRGGGFGAILGFCSSGSVAWLSGGVCVGGCAGVGRVLKVVFIGYI